MAARGPGAVCRYCIRQGKKESLLKASIFPRSAQETDTISDWSELGHSPLNQRLTRRQGHVSPLDPSGPTKSSGARVGARTGSGPWQHGKVGNWLLGGHPAVSRQPIIGGYSASKSPMPVTPVYLSLRSLHQKTQTFVCEMDRVNTYSIFRSGVSILVHH